MAEIKTIQLHEDVYMELVKHKNEKQTFNDVLRELLNMDKEELKPEDIDHYQGEIIVKSFRSSVRNRCFYCRCRFHNRYADQTFHLDFIKSNGLRYKSESFHPGLEELRPLMEQLGEYETDYDVEFYDKTINGVEHVNL